MLTVCMLALLAGHPKLAELEPRLELLLEREWAQTRRTESPDLTQWFFTQTPLFPAAWPLNGKAVVFAYAWRRGGVMEPDHISTLWGAVHIDGDGALTFERLAEAIEEVGAQQRKPPQTKESGADWRRLAERVQAGVLSARSVKAFEALRARVFYDDWRAWHPVVAQQVSSRATPFFDYLNSSSR